MTKQVRRINVEQASIKTAAVEIKVVTINGKQMTLSVFRQIPHEELIDYETFQIRGIPWGIVNYRWNGDSPNLFYRKLPNGYEPADGKAMHVLWQDGQELRRTVVYRFRSVSSISEVANELDETETAYKHVYFACKHRNISDPTKLSIEEAVQKIERGEEVFILWRDADFFEFNMGSDLTECINFPRIGQFSPENISWAKSYYENCRSKISEHVHKKLDNHVLTGLRIKELHDRLACLPQLFIAI